MGSKAVSERPSALKEIKDSDAQSTVAGVGCLVHWFPNLDYRQVLAQATTKNSQGNMTAYT